MKKIVFAVLGLILLITFALLREKKEFSEPVYCGYINKISKTFIVDAQKKYDIHCVGSGGALMDQVNIISLSFHSRDKNVTIDNARILMVRCVEEYLERINSNKDIRPYLSHYPFSSKGINFDISFQNPSQETLKLVFLSKGNIVYMVEDPEQAPLVRKHKEPYEEAKAIVMAEQKEAL